MITEKEFNDILLQKLDVVFRHHMDMFFMSILFQRDIELLLRLEYSNFILVHGNPEDWSVR